MPKAATPALTPGQQSNPSGPEPMGTPQPSQLLPAAMPEPLRRFIGSIVPFEPSVENELYKKKKPLWDLYMKLYELERDDLQLLIEPHNKDEDKDKLALRKTLAAVYNLIPTIVQMTVSYVYTESPAIDVGNDTDLSAFVANCDGNGTPLDHFVKQTILPMAQVLGMVDVLVQNPLVSADQVRTAKDRQDAGVAPVVFPVFPQQRLNWSTRQSHEYNWVCFLDEGSDDPNPLRRNVRSLVSYITLSAALPDVDPDHGFWVRSWQPFQVTGSGTPPVPAPPVPAGAVHEGMYYHEADFCPTRRVPVSSVYWHRSNDPKKRHYGISKIAVMASLTVNIIQLLSWLMEDVLSNLALLALPTKGGRLPTAADGTPIVVNLAPSSYLTYDSDAKHPPRIVQGNVAHITAKLSLIDSHVREILRLGNLLGASADAERISSGVQGVVMRNELFRELKDAADSLDTFTMELLALAKSWITGDDWSADDLKKSGVSVRFFKGPYATEPLEAVIKATTAAIEMLREVSPTACQKAYEQTVRHLVPADNPDLPKALEEVAENTGAVLERQSLESETQAASAAADAVETSMKNDLSTNKRSYESNAA